MPNDLQEKLENELFEFVEKEEFHMHAEKRDELPTSPTLVNVIRKLIEKGVIEGVDYEDGIKEGKEEGIEEATRNFGKALINENYSEDRKSTRLNSSHVAISYAVYCLKKNR